MEQHEPGDIGFKQGGIDEQSGGPPFTSKIKRLFCRLQLPHISGGGGKIPYATTVYGAPEQVVRALDIVRRVFACPTAAAYAAWFTNIHRIILVREVR